MGDKKLIKKKTAKTKTQVLLRFERCGTYNELINFKAVRVSHAKYTLSHTQTVKIFWILSFYRLPSIKSGIKRSDNVLVTSSVNVTLSFGELGQ